MGDFILDSRLKTILLHLANATEITTVKQIADEVGVSRRTILRDLQEAEEWLKKNGFTLESKSGKGIRLAGDEADRERLINLISDKVPEVINMPRDRQKMLLVELLQMKEPVKLYYYTSKFGVSISTLSNDLDKVEIWLSKYNLKLIRKAGLGVYVSGEEKDFRRAMISLLYENLSEEELMMIIKNTVPGFQTKESVTQASVRNRLLDLIDRDSIEKIESVLLSLEKTLPYKMVESARIGLMVHLALAIQRIKNNEKITIDSSLLNELKRLYEFSVAANISRKISENFDIEIPEDEIGYITMHLNGARFYNNSLSEIKKSENKDLFEIANEMVSIAEKEFSVNFAEREKLLNDLVCHLDPALKRLQMGMDIRNPLLHKLKHLFPDAYKISTRAADVLKEKLSIVVPESEIGFLAMHFGAAIEKNRLETNKNIRIIVACPSGIGTSRLLSARLQKEFKELEIVDILSTYEMSLDHIKDKNIDFVVSTVPIQNCAVKNICVNPLLLEDDKLYIEQVIYGTGRNKTESIKRPGTRPLKSSIKHTLNYSSFIQDIIENNWFYLNEDASDINHVISDISPFISSNKEIQNSIKKQILNKEVLIVNNSCIVLNIYLKDIKSSSLVACRLSQKLILEYCGAGLSNLIILVIPEKLRGSHNTYIKDFNTFISNSKITECTDPKEFSETLYATLSVLYMEKLDEWRTKLYESINLNAK